MIRTHEEVVPAAINSVAEKMLVAALTAPKGRGQNLLYGAIFTGEEITALAEQMETIGEQHESHAFIRDAGNIRQASAVVILGTRTASLGLKYCGLCGYPDCAAREAGDGGWCAFNTGDLGIAIGSAVSVAADHRVDNRIMYTVGMAALEMGILGEGVCVAYGIPLSGSGKNPFFDRK